MDGIQGKGQGAVQSPWGNSFLGHFLAMGPRASGFEPPSVIFHICKMGC